VNKVEAMRLLSKRILECRLCRLWENRTHAVPGEGNLDAEIMFIGEAPGRFEDLEGRPFVGAAGKLLTELVEGIGLRREDVYITNVVKCRPPGNRDPKPDEIRTCSPYLDEQIQIIRPSIIVTLGRHSTGYILSRVGISTTGISRVRGRIFKVSYPPGINVIVIPTYHPAAALYNPKIKDYLKRDFHLIKRCLSEVRREDKKIGLEKFL